MACEILDLCYKSLFGFAPQNQVRLPEVEELVYNIYKERAAGTLGNRTPPRVDLLLCGPPCCPVCDSNMLSLQIQKTLLEVQ